MGYRNKTYIIFDGDNDMWAYGFMKGWKTKEHIDFDFHDAHDIRPLTYNASDEKYIKDRLRERFNNSKQVIVLVGDSTKNLYRYVRWEIEVAIELGLPIIVVNLNGKKEIDHDKCPPILKTYLAMHVPFKLAAIKYAMDEFIPLQSTYKYRFSGPLNYPASIYDKLGL